MKESDESRFCKSVEKTFETPHGLHRQEARANDDRIPHAGPPSKELLDLAVA